MRTWYMPQMQWRRPAPSRAWVSVVIGLAGAVVGAVLVVLLTPRTGLEVRRALPARVGRTATRNSNADELAEERMTSEGALPPPVANGGANGADGGRRR